MIGDWVQSFGEPHKIIGIRTDTPYPYIKTNMSDTWYEWGMKDLADGIPLTPEILEKNGLWEKDPDRNPNCLIAEANTTNFNDAEGKPHSWVQIQDISSIECSRWYLKIWGKGKLGISGYVGYVHELQHALRLCGIDKEITL